MNQPGTAPVTLKWETFTDAADEAGLSGRLAGVQFEQADLAGRKLGRLVADRAWTKAQGYFDGSDTSPAPSLTAEARNRRKRPPS